MQVRAKFKVKTISDEGSGLRSVTLTAVMPGDGANQSKENAEFFKYTPTGEIRLGVLNEAASRVFQVGDEYYVDFTPAKVSAA
jgi:hypothetical protein